ncbi:hypothetical protein ACJX0J_027017, partial [Zea mays]
YIIWHTICDVLLLIYHVAYLHCTFCGLEETIYHLFFDRHITMFFWNLLFIIFNQIGHMGIEGR